MRCRSNRFGQAWPGQAAEAEFAQGSSPRAYKASMLSADALIGSCKSHNASNATRTLAIFLPFGSSLETGATINTHRPRLAQRLSPTHF
jgi:hypothetical protein